MDVVEITDRLWANALGLRVPSALTVQRSALSRVSVERLAQDSSQRIFSSAWRKCGHLRLAMSAIGKSVSHYSDVIRHKHAVIAHVIMLAPNRSVFSLIPEFLVPDILSIISLAPRMGCTPESMDPVTGVCLVEAALRTTRHCQTAVARPLKYDIPLSLSRFKLAWLFTGRPILCDYGTLIDEESMLFISDITSVSDTGRNDYAFYFMIHHPLCQFATGHATFKGPVSETFVVQLLLTMHR
ncbi:uncharacterized protein An14g05610 [Aspergillus niger]|uniref:Contig An14c0180, genomic contig n=2 Tax=Aspergillus niger TaxID=5061 RepID=A2R3V4_ASPNC|nr:uncharacterized protein An14g05610 [Aspergillus niger]CAK42122.1 unnamed protein product [Aspergillus niger]